MYTCKICNAETGWRLAYEDILYSDKMFLECGSCGAVEWILPEIKDECTAKNNEK